MTLINSKQEIKPLKKHDEFGIEVLIGKEKLTLNSNQKGLYIDLCSFSLAIGISISKLLEVISYSPITNEYLAFYRIEQKIVKLIDVKGVEILIRNLMASGHDLEVLKTIRNQIKKTIEQMEKE
ncbi:hypothetical protein [Bacillus sp. B1-b2]|uniref:hypothetical protein n=1 Tax=Bacillus sp. B1-b2 TaxID=2653201 RepID=UPI00126249BC|nr:hypothetical protein [Bacillus sp. B1-b2]KAB7663382.1 hypothetical protein F9279_24105 [Bacillus sp. B1-b2]